MKRLASIAVLVLLLIHFVGFYVYFVVRLGHIRQEMRVSITLLPEEEMEVFRLTPEEYKRARINDHEVQINGKMYDHSPPQAEGTLIVLYARHDQSEDNLLSFLKEVVRTASTDHQQAPSQIMNFMTLFFLPVGSLSLAKETLTEKINLFHPIIFHAFYPALEPPPPKA